MRILHIVVTGSFAGTERYVCEVGRSCAELGDDVTVVGGDPRRMRGELGDGVRWLRGASMPAAARSVLRAGRFDVCHLHLTKAEAVGTALRRRHRGLLVSTRHIAGHRGSRRLGTLLAPWIAAHLDAEIAISRFVAGRLERPPTTVLHNGVRDCENLWRPESRVVLVMQRLEPEKDTWTAIEGWHRSGMADRGWKLRIVGDGSQRAALQDSVRGQQVGGITFVGWRPDVRAELATAAVLLAPAPAEPLGLSVLEAMAAGVPVIAAGGGGHLESVGHVEDSWLFRPGDVQHVAERLLSFAEGGETVAAQRSSSLTAAQRERFSLRSHVIRLRSLYENCATNPLQRDGAVPVSTAPLGSADDRISTRHLSPVLRNGEDKGIERERGQ